MLSTKLIDHIAIIRFNRPAERNPLSRDTLLQLEATISTLTTNPNVTAIIITGTGDVFASGADIRELIELEPKSAAEFSRLGQRVLHSIAVAPQRTIAAVNGYCMGGALDLALACDLRIAARNAVFAHPGARLGIITGWGGTQRLARLVGRTRALGLFLTAARINSDVALAAGLVSAVVDDALEHALTLAAKLPQ